MLSRKQTHQLLDALPGLVAPLAADAIRVVLLPGGAVHVLALLLARGGVFDLHLHHEAGDGGVRYRQLLLVVDDVLVLLAEAAGQEGDDDESGDGRPDAPGH